MSGSSLWWFGLAIPLALFMVVAMMEFTVRLLVRSPRGRKYPLDRDTLEQRLLGHTFETLPVRITRAARGGLEIRDYEIGDERRESLRRVAFSIAYRARMAFDERRHELRWYESVRGRTLFLGFDGWVPHVHFGLWYHGGLVDLVGTVHAYSLEPGFPPRPGPSFDIEMDTVQLKHEVTEIVTRAGWSFRPVTLPFFATGGWLALSRRIVPSRLARVPEKWLWGIVYPLSYVVLIGCLLWAARLEDPNAWNRENLLITLLVSAAWWGVWGLLTWILHALSNAPRRSRSRRAR
jgi:hypothetical protein